MERSAERPCTVSYRRHPTLSDVDGSNSHIKICNSHLKVACLATPSRPLPIMTTKRRAQPHNAYNIFFILERKRLIYELEGSVVDNHQQMSYDLDGYENLCLPHLPPKFQHLHLPPGWFVPGKNSKRKHAKTHGSKLIVNHLLAFTLFNYVLFLTERFGFCLVSHVIRPSCAYCRRELEECRSSY